MCGMRLLEFTPSAVWCWSSEQAYLLRAACRPRQSFSEGWPHAVLVRPVLIWLEPSRRSASPIPRSPESLDQTRSPTAHFLKSFERNSIESFPFFEDYWRFRRANLLTS